MKKMFVLLLLVACFNCASAQTMLKVFLMDKSQITLEIDGRHYHKVGTSITVGDLPPGRHHIRIFQFVKNKFGRSFEDIIYDGLVKTHYGKINLFEYDPITGSLNTYDEDIETYQKQLDVRYDSSGTSNGNMANRSPLSAPVRVNQQQPDQSMGIRNVESSATAMTMQSGKMNADKIKALKAKADEESADSRKLLVVKDGLANEHISTAEVGMVMDWFNFESSKVEFAIWVYDIVVDKENYSSLSSKFTYKNYQDDFDNFLIKKH